MAQEGLMPGQCISPTTVPSWFFRVPALGRGWFLIVGLLGYAIFSFPFPRNPGAVEVLIGLLLVMAVGWQGASTAWGGVFLRSRGGIGLKLVSISFAWLLCVPLLVGVLMQWHVVDIIRDVIPLIYLYIPVLLLPFLLRSRLDWAWLLMWLLSIVGVIFSIRFFIITGAALSDIGRTSLFDDLLYLPYDPSVLFAGIFLPLMAIIRVKLSRPSSIFKSMIMLMGGLLSLAALAGVVQRAPLGLAVLAMLIFLLRMTRHSFWRSVVLALVIGVVVILAYEQITGIWELLLKKQALHGFNQKLEELIVIASGIGSSPINVLFGLGWGGLFRAPAYGGLAVSFTHSLPSYILLKTGILGVVMFIVFAGWVLRRYLRAMLRVWFDNTERLPGLLAASASLMIGLLFQPTFKLLTYGVIVLALVLLGERMGERKDAILPNQRNG